MRRRKLLVALAGLVAVFAFVFWPRPDRVTKENFLRVQLGATRSQVEEILGHPGDYRTAPTESKAVVAWLSERSPVAGITITEWQGNTGFVQLGFDQEGRVAWGKYQGQALQDVGRLNLLFWRLDRLGRR